MTDILMGNLSADACRVIDRDSESSAAALAITVQTRPAVSLKGKS